MVSSRESGYGTRGTGVHCAAPQGVIDVFNPVRKQLSISRMRTWIADDRGAAALIIAAVVAVIAFTALSIFLNSFIGGRELARTQSASSDQGNLVQAVFASFLSSGSGGTYTLPCPDTAASPTGAAGTCNSSTTTAGVLPWAALGLSRADAVDAYGNYYTYVVSSQGKTMCQSIGSSAYTGVTAEATGALTAVTDLTLSAPTGTRKVAFAIVGHGANRRNAKSATTGTTSGDGSSHEQANGATGLTGSSVTVYADAFSNTSGSAFDDQVFAPSNSDMEKICKALTPGGQLNASLSENFDGASQRATSTPNSAKFAGTSTATVIADARTTSGTGNYVASFATAGTALVSNASTYSTNFDPRIRRIYMSARWTPDPLSAVSGTSTVGMSFATRATAADRTSTSDDFTSNTGYGITFRFNCGSAANDSSFCGGSAGANIGTSAVANYLSIREGGTSLAHSSGSYNIIRGKTYIIEAFDDGANLWARITQEDNPSNSASVSYSTTTADLAGSQQLIFVAQGAALSYLDDLSFGMPMLALETNGSSGMAATSTAANGFTSSSGAHSLSVEAWVRPRVLPTGTNIGTIIGKWDSSVAAANNAYRLYVNSNGAVHFEISGDDGGDGVEDYTTPITLKVNTWTHVAATYDAASKAVTFYQNGIAAGAAVSAINTSTGVTYETLRCFTVGAEYTGGSCSSASTANGFNGSISDVRVWEEARTASNILANYETRLAYAGTVSNLIVNWKLDLRNGLLTGNPENTPSTIGASGSLINTANYGATLALYFRPLSTSVCPSNYVGPYQCDFRTSSSAGQSSTLTVVSNLPEVYVKAWGGGGGAYDVGTNERAGGAGGFSGAILRRVSTTDIANTSPDIYVGGYGTGSTSVNNGAGGGGGSGVFSGANAGVAAGGGGGASYSIAGSCASASGTSACGLGGAGGGAGALTSRAPDASLNCGGRGGDNSPSGSNPPDGGTNCGAGGQDPASLGRNGGTGGGSNAGGGPTGVIAGGAGNNAGSATRVGGGGGGGGAIGGEAGGYDSGANNAGYGGGGGSGTVDSGGTTNVAGQAGDLASGSFSDASRNGDLSNGSTTITGISTLSSSGWTTGMYINGNGIPGNTTISSINTGAGSIVISQAATSNANNVNLTVTSAGTGSYAGGDDDLYYSPSYVAASMQNPGRGGAPGSVNGHPGAVVILW